MRLTFQHLYESQIPLEVSEASLKKIALVIVKHLDNHLQLDKYWQLLIDQGYANSGTLKSSFTAVNYSCYLTTIIREKIGPEWKLSNGGTFPKRLSSYLHKTYSIKLSTEVLREIGTIASAEQTKDRIIYWDVFNCSTGKYWEDGNYGDGGSCLWGSNAEALDQFQASKSFYAIRVYNSQKLLEGMKQDGSDTPQLFYRSMIKQGLHREHRYGRARAWMHKINANEFIVFNGYDSKGELQALHLARIFATEFGMIYHRIHLENNGSDSNTIYINGGQGQLIYEADNDTARNRKSYDFGIECEGDCDDDHERECNCCGDYAHEDDMYHTVDGRVCPHCAENSYAECQWSGDYLRINDTTYVEDTYIGKIGSMGTPCTRWYEGSYDAERFADYIVEDYDQRCYRWKANMFEWGDGYWYSEPEPIEEELAINEIIEECK